MDYTASQILIGPPFTDHAQGQVSADKTLTVNIQVTDIDDATAQAGQVEIAVDLSAVSSSVDVVGLSTNCDTPSVDTVICTVQLPDVAAPVPVPAQAIGLRARAGTPAEPVGTIGFIWSLNNNTAPSTASLDVVVIPPQTPTDPPTSTTTTRPAITTRPPTTHPATTPAVIKPVPMKASPSPEPSPSPTPEVTMTPDPTPQPLAGADPIAGGPPAPIPFATPPGDGGAWRSPALYLSLGTAAAGLLIALAYAVISLRKAGREPS
jgi:hypothetical protein